MKLKFDLHCHSHYSADGVARPEDMVEVARAKGLHGFAITDHNTPECIDWFLSHGYMREDGMPVDGMLIIPGQEITTDAGHLLVYGVHLPDMKGVRVQEAVERVHELGGLAVPAHPYDLFRAGIREKVLRTLKSDAIEVFNAATTFRRYNRLAFNFAKAAGLPMTAGSDAHHADAIGTAYTTVDAEEFTLAGVLRAIVCENELAQGYMSARDALRKTFNNVFRIKGLKAMRGKTRAIKTKAA